jgi:thymidylate kinase
MKMKSSSCTGIYVWEGPDGSGKTTQRNEFAAHMLDLGYTVHMFERKSHTPDGDYLEWIRHTAEDWQRLTKLSKEFDFVLVDRYYPSSYVYGHFLGDYTQKQINTALGEIPKADLIIYMMPPSEVLRKRVTERGDGDDPDESDRKRKAYLAFLSSRLCKKNEFIVLEDVVESST